MEHEIHIVLLEPQIPQNTGNIARTCVVTGAKLHLIEPLGFSLDEKHLRRAGLDYWNHLALTVHKNYEAFLAAVDLPVFYLTTKGQTCYSDVSFPRKCAICFGREDKGIPESILRANYDHALRIPMRENERSLNLSNAAAILTYEVLRQHDFPMLQNFGALTK